MRILRFRERNPTRASSLPMRTGSLGNGQIFAHYTFCLIALFVASAVLTGFPSSGLSVPCFALLHCLDTVSITQGIWDSLQSTPCGEEFLSANLFLW